MRAVGWLAIAAGCLTLLALALATLLWYAIYRDRSHPQVAAQIVINRGESFAEIGRQLASEGIISNVLTFRLVAHLREEESAVRAGEYRFTPHLTQDEVLRALVTGGAQVAAWVTIPEGFTAAQIAQRLQAAGVGQSAVFLRDFMHERLMVAGVRTKNLEGFLFPSTYLVPFGASSSQVAALMTAEFFKQLPPDAASRARAMHVRVPAAVTVASLVEREAKSEVDRPKIAGVIYNRLRLRMPLQVDATIEYALPEHKTVLSFADLKINSPFNTYVRVGLPPTPIANPGRPSLVAAFHPAKNNDLYYVYCGNGRHVFAATLAEHQANVARCLH